MDHWARDAGPGLMDPAFVRGRCDGRVRVGPLIVGAKNSCSSWGQSRSATVVDDDAARESAALTFWPTLAGLTVFASVAADPVGAPPLAFLAPLTLPSGLARVASLPGDGTHGVGPDPIDLIGSNRDVDVGRVGTVSPTAQRWCLQKRDVYRIGRTLLHTTWSASTMRAPPIIRRR